MSRSSKQSNPFFESGDRRDIAAGTIMQPSAYIGVSKPNMIPSEVGALVPELHPKSSPTRAPWQSSLMLSVICSHVQMPLYIDWCIGPEGLAIHKPRYPSDDIGILWISSMGQSGYFRDAVGVACCMGIINCCCSFSHQASAVCHWGSVCFM